MSTAQFRGRIKSIVYLYSKDATPIYLEFQYIFYVLYIISVFLYCFFILFGRAVLT